MRGPANRRGKPARVGRASRHSPVCNAARSFGTPGVGFARMRRWGGRGFRIPCSTGAARRNGMRDPAALGRARGTRVAGVRRPKPAKAGRASRPPLPRPQCCSALWNPPRGICSGAPLGWVGGLLVPSLPRRAGREARPSGARIPRRRGARPVCNAARSFGTPRGGGRPDAPRGC